ncbi:MAG TPA: RluA family pseudouridine synthase [Kofleriaceae bacterium]|nr:RluA family pseudouridine synthase [Kofleriaceae bacterium]
MSDGDDDDELIEVVVVESGRLDAVIAASVPEMSRAQAQRLIDDGRVARGGVVAAKSGARVLPGDVIVIRVPPPEPLEVTAEPIALAILYEDAELIVIDKPAGMVVHPAPGHPSGTLVNALLFHCTDLAGIGGVLRPGIVHRLDKDTTGAMVATKTDRAHASLTAQFAAKSRGEPGGISREYLAIASPPPPTPTGTLRTAYGRHPIQRKKFTSKLAGGKPAVTHWQIVESLYAGDAALVRFVLETGRTHQIRVHASDAGWPLLGDPVYGHKPRTEQLAEAARILGRQALHAHTLAFTHPTTGTRMSFTAPIPEDFVRATGTVSTTTT